MPLTSPPSRWPVYIGLALTLQLTLTSTSTLTSTLTSNDLTMPGLDALIDMYHEHCPSLQLCITTKEGGNPPQIESTGPMTEEEEIMPWIESIPLTETLPIHFNNDTCCPIQCSCDDFCLVQDNCCPDFYKKLINREISPEEEFAESEDAFDHVREIIKRKSEEMKMKLYFEQNELIRDMIKEVDSDLVSSIWGRSMCMDASISSLTTNTPTQSTFYMVASCPSEDPTPSDNYTDLCEGPPSTDVQLSDIPPVISYKTFITYKNKHCMICNEGGNRSNVFRTELQCLTDKSVQLPSMQSFYDILQYAKTQDECSLIFEDGIIGLVNPCKKVQIDSCNVTGLWTNFDEDINKACSLYRSPVEAYIIQYSSRPLTFNNIACYKCNTAEGDTFSNSCQMDERGMSNNTVSVGLYLTEDEYGYLPINGFVRENFFDYKDGPCEMGQFYDKYMDRCREMICPRDHFIDGSYCSPMFDRMGGITASLQLKLTLNSTFFMTMLSDMEEAIHQAIIRYFMLELYDVSVCKSSIWRKYTDSEPIKVQYFFIYIALTVNGYLTYGDIWYSVKNIVNSVNPFDEIIDFNMQPIKYDVTFAENFLLTFHHGELTKVINLENDYLEESDTNFNHITNNCKVSLSITANSFCERVALSEDEYEIEDSALKLKLDQTNYVYLQNYDLAKDNKRAFICIHLYKNLQASMDATKEEVSISKVTNLNVDITVGADQEDIEMPFFMGIIITVVSMSSIFLGLHLLRNRCFPREGEGQQHIDMTTMGSTASSNEPQEPESV